MTAIPSSQAPARPDPAQAIAVVRKIAGASEARSRLLVVPTSRPVVV